LPLLLARAFVFGVGSKRYCLLRLPFGWDKSPTIFQHHVQALVDQLDLDYDVLVLQYLDDFLLVSSDRSKLEVVCASLAKGLSNAGFVIADSKSVVVPARYVTWLGKLLIAGTFGVVVLTDVDVLVDVGALIVWVCSRFWPRPVMRQMTGVLCWACIHHRLGLPFLQPGHRFLCGGDPVPSKDVRDALCEALFMASLPANKPLFYTNDASPTFVPWVFWDASVVHGYVGVVVGFTPDFPVLTYSMRLPNFIVSMGAAGQQLAELYGMKFAVLRAMMLHLKHIALIGDSQSALSSALKLSCPASMTSRGKVLRQLVRMMVRHWVTAKLGYVPSQLNPADDPSKPDEAAGNAKCLALMLRSQPALISWDPKEWHLHKSRVGGWFS